MTNIAALIDHTLLKPEATRADVLALIAEAAELGTYSVCVSPSFLPLDLPASLKPRRGLWLPPVASTTPV